MARYRTTVHTPADTTTALNYLADFSSLTDWDPSAVESVLISGDSGHIGATYRVRVRLGLITLPFTYEVVEREGPDTNGGARVALRAETADVISYDVMTFSPAPGGGTAVTYDADLAPKGYRRLFDPGFALVMRVIGDRARAGLRRVLADLPAAAQDADQVDAKRPDAGSDA